MSVGPVVAGRRRVRRRRLALGLVAYGATGLALALASLVVLAGLASTVESLASRRADLVRWLDLAVTTLSDVERAGANAADGLVAAEGSSRSASALFQQLSTTMAGLREASSVEILGSRPLGSVTDDLDRVASQSGTLAQEMGNLATALGDEKASLDRLEEDAGRLRAEVAQLRDEVAAGGTGGFQGVGGLTALMILVVAWLALPAVVSLVLGVEELRRQSRAHRGARAGTGPG